MTLLVLSFRMYSVRPCFHEKYLTCSSSSIVGRARHPGIMVGMAQKDSYVG